MNNLHNSSETMAIKNLKSTPFDRKVSSRHDDEPNLRLIQSRHKGSRTVVLDCTCRRYVKALLLLLLLCRCRFSPEAIQAERARALIDAEESITTTPALKCVCGPTAQWRGVSLAFSSTALMTDIRYLHCMPLPSVTKIKLIFESFWCIEVEIFVLRWLKKGLRRDIRTRIIMSKTSKLPVFQFFFSFFPYLSF